MPPKPPDILRKSHQHTEGKERATSKARLRQQMLEEADELDSAHRYAGACTCGAIRYAYRTRVPPADWTLRRCACAFCTRHDALYALDPEGSVEIRAADFAETERHRFALESIVLLSCRGCGDFVAAVTPGNGDRLAVVNLRLLEDPPELPHAPQETPAECALLRHARLGAPLSPSSDV